MPRSTEDSLREIAKVLLRDTERARKAAGIPRTFVRMSDNYLVGKDREVFRALVAEMEEKP